MRYAVAAFCLVALAEISSGQSDCPTGDAQCDAEHPGSYCKHWKEGEEVCQYTDTPCSCTTTPPPGPSPTGGPCPDGDAFCQQQSGDMNSYCKAAYKPGDGGVCQGSDEPCTCDSSPTTSQPTSAEPTSPEATTAEPSS
ncbi:hypothetical protein FOL47_004313 [Perkinsus chesapeaki]|uniref:Uncharacterized protein n=1 Tax=Perkinsus chesapeaki TaxID=330153 RepID=A0A7J6M4A2_PERCH|nr:hypothetical protein FOL47_004313 [Perkinsus chesapeaki]